MPIVLISESLMRRSTLKDGSILRDRVLSGFCVRMNPRKRTFRVATSIKGKQYRLNLGYWPLMSVEQARARAMEVLTQCRQGVWPAESERPSDLPTLRTAYVDYCAAKKVKASSKGRYDSFFRTHFGDWLDRPVSDLELPAFFTHCQKFAQSKGAALVELGRGVVGAVLKYVNAAHGLALASPFVKLAILGAMPQRAQPRARMLQESNLPAWQQAVDQLGERQRDFLLLTLYTGLRLNECRGIARGHVDLVGGVLNVPVTKNGKAHSLPITPLMREILERRCAGLEAAQQLFTGVAADHLSKMAGRVGAPAFMLHDLRKLVATAGKQLGIDDAVLRRILNHTPPRSDVLHRHYVELAARDLTEPLRHIQERLHELTKRKESARNPQSSTCVS